MAACKTYALRGVKRGHGLTRRRTHGRRPWLRRMNGLALSGLILNLLTAPLWHLAGTACRNAAIADHPSLTCPCPHDAVTHPEGGLALAAADATHQHHRCPICRAFKLPLLGCPAHKQPAGRRFACNIYIRSNDNPSPLIAPGAFQARAPPLRS